MHSHAQKRSVVGGPTVSCCRYVADITQHICEVNFGLVANCVDVIHQLSSRRRPKTRVEIVEEIAEGHRLCQVDWDHVLDEEPVMKKPL